jgi:hypothetical protein
MSDQRQASNRTAFRQFGIIRTRIHRPGRAMAASVALIELTLRRRGIAAAGIRNTWSSLTSLLADI